MSDYGRIPWKPIEQGMVARLTGASAKVLVVVAGHVRRAGDDRAWPAEDQIASLAGLHVGSVKRAIRGLEELGFLAVERGCGRKHHSTYVLGNGSAGATIPDTNGSAGASERVAPAHRKGSAGATRMRERNKRREGSAASPPACNDDNRPWARTREPFAEGFKGAFDGRFPEAGGYAWTRGDFVQLAAWRKAHPALTVERFVAVAQHHWGRGQYTPKGSLTIRGLCTGWEGLAALAGNADPRPTPAQTDDYSAAKLARLRGTNP